MPDPAELKAVMERLKCALSTPFGVIDWEELADDLSILLTALEAQAWRGIEGAPDDLRLFLGIDMRAPSPTVHFCTVKASHLSPPGSWYVTNGSSIQPTHWQPLPTPPVSEEQR